MSSGRVSPISRRVATPLALMPFIGVDPARFTAVKLSNSVEVATSLQLCLTKNRGYSVYKWKQFPSDIFPKHSFGHRFQDGTQCWNDIASNIAKNVAAMLRQHRRQPQDNVETTDRPDLRMNCSRLDSEALSIASDMDA